MGIKVHYKKFLKGVSLESGKFYTFRYRPFENDPEPVIIFLNAFSGVYDSTQHDWTFFQGINLTYLPRHIRKQFVKDWQNYMGKGIRFTWRMIKSKYPQLMPAIRRYDYRPSKNYIKDLKEIPPDQLDKVVISTFSRDFSKKIRSFLFKRYKEIMKSRFNIINKWRLNQ